MKFEFVIPAYGKPHHLMMAIESIYCQTVSNWKISVYADGQYDGFDKVGKYFDGDDRISFEVMESRSNDWGHSPRVHGMMKATEEWLIMTGDDNYYMPCFVEAFTSCAKENANFIFCDFLHNYSGYVPEKARLDKVQFQHNGIIGHRYEGMDIGCFATRTKLAQTVPYNKKLHWADGQFAADYWEAHCKHPESIVHINRHFYVHN
jgi:glycosyltransferase involved in cell wall biosynthesis